MWFLVHSACMAPDAPKPDAPTVLLPTEDTATGDTAAECVATVETCNTLDDDCDSLVDEEASDVSLWYADADGDVGLPMARRGCAGWRLR